MISVRPAPAEDSEGPEGSEGSPRAFGVRQALRSPRLPHVLLGLGLFAAYTTFSLARYHRFASMSWDLAIFEQVVRSYAHLQAPVSAIKGHEFNILGDHFSPVLVLLAPLYRVFPSPMTLLVVQAALFAVSAVIVSATAARFLGRTRGLLVGAAYGLSWGVQRAVDFDFHEIAFAVPLLAMVLRQFLLGRWRHVVYWSLPLVLVKEDLGLTVAAVGVCLFLARQRRAGAALAVFGAAATAAVLFVIIPSFNPSNGYDYWDKVSDEKTDSPSLLSGLFDGLDIKGETLLWIIGVTAFLALRSTLVLIAVPTLAWRFVSHEGNYWGTDWHYSAVLMPIVFMALIHAVRDADRSRRPWIRRYARNAVPAVTAIAATMCLQLPIRDLIQSETYDGGQRVEQAKAALKEIPDGATVEANTGLMSHLTGRTTVYWVGNTAPITPEYIALDLATGWSSPLTDPVGYARQLHPSARYELVFHQGPYAVMALRDGPGQGSS
ncbi:DUF2079 domain-containing protein [Streptomyces sp. NPDC000594]|uniref:DUF2079 domain-containing protein n=1 Tax=Streptomyces sp. NPDC000594 TaxID=3154261 RepID=UPI0033345CBE